VQLLLQALQQMLHHQQPLRALQQHLLRLKLLPLQHQQQMALQPQHVVLSALCITSKQPAAPA
jgi:hypothetical protein